VRQKYFVESAASTDKRGAIVPKRENERRPCPGISKAVAAYFQPNRQKAPVLSAGYPLGRAPDTLIGVTEKRSLFLHPRGIQNSQRQTVSPCVSTMIDGEQTA
jgi:hypothetical protein